MTRPRSNPFSTLNLHIAGVALFAALNLFLAVRFLMAWRDVHSDRDQQIAQQEITLTRLKVQAAHLSGLPDKVKQARSDAGGFYDRRIPTNYSSVVAQLGEITTKSGVRLTRASYTPGPAIPGLTEVRIDANLSGEYTGMMHFINGVERDQTFFLIDGLTLTGQQGGLVNLRLRMTVYLRSDGHDVGAPPAVAELAPASAEVR